MLSILAMVPKLLAHVSAEPGPGAAGVESVWDFALKGGVLMIPIGVCSLVALAVIVERALSLRRARVIPPEFTRQLRETLSDSGRDPAVAIKHCEQNDSPLARVLATGLRHLDQPREHVERAIEQAGQREVFRLRKYFRTLSVIVAVAPMLGLLGTVFGMIQAFQTVAASAEALGRTELLAQGIYEALITTATGLLVAIPALIGYHWLSGRVERLVIDMDTLAVEFVGTHTRRVPRAARAAEPRDGQRATLAGPASTARRAEATAEHSEPAVSPS